MQEANSALPNSNTISQYLGVASEPAHKPKLLRRRCCYQVLMTTRQPSAEIMLSSRNKWKLVQESSN